MTGVGMTNKGNEGTLSGFKPEAEVPLGRAVASLALTT